MYSTHLSDLNGILESSVLVHGEKSRKAVRNDILLLAYV